MKSKSGEEHKILRMISHEIVKRNESVYKGTHRIGWVSETFYLRTHGKL